MHEPSRQWTDAEFVKSSFSGNNPNACVEVAMHGDLVALRNSTHGGQGPTVEYTTAEWRAFLAGVTAGEFDV